MFFFFFKQKTAYEMRISDWSSDVCSSDLDGGRGDRAAAVHPPRARRQFVERVAIEPGGNAHLPRAQPVMLERDQPHVASDIAERVHVAMPVAEPVFEFDPELEGAVRRAHEMILVDPECVEIEPQLRNRRFTDADGADRLRFDQPDPIAALQEPPERGGGHPPRGAAAGDHDRIRGLLHRRSLSQRVSRTNEGAAAPSEAATSGGSRQNLYETPI